MGGRDFFEGGTGRPFAFGAGSRKTFGGELGGDWNRMGCVESKSRDLGSDSRVQGGVERTEMDGVSWAKCGLNPHGLKMRLCHPNSIKVR